MKLQKIEIENFASYYGKHNPIHLETTREKPLIIFVGGTGNGKTSLFDAINWALYGREYEKDLINTKEKNITDYLNETAVSEALRTGQSLSMSVTLHFEHISEYDNNHELREFYITQTIVVKPNNSNTTLKLDIIDRQTHLREIKENGDHHEISYTTMFLDEILPNNVKSYFLFDGDRIHNLAKPANHREVRDAIYRVVDLEIVQNAITHLKDSSIDFNRKAANLAEGELADVMEKHLETINEEDALKKEITTLKKERKAIGNQIFIIDEKLKNLPETSKLQERKNSVDSDLKKNRITQKESKVRLREKASKALQGLASESMGGLMNLLQEKRKKGEIPKYIRETFFSDLFEIEECVCGTRFQAKKGDPIYDALILRLENEKNRSGDEDKLIDLYHQLGGAQDAIDTAKKEMEEEEDKITDLEREERSLILQLKEVNDQLKDLPIEDINKLINERRDREEEDKKHIETITQKESLLEPLNIRIKEHAQRIKDLGKQNKEARAFHLRAELSKKSSEELSNLYDAFAEQSRQSVEELTIQEFRKFVISSSEYKVVLTHDYALGILDSNGSQALQRLSMGQSQCLSLAFITAISRVSKKHPPLVIDMPFSRLDQRVHEAVSMRLPYLAEQTILFLIPGVEWNETTKKHLEGHANYLYEMSFEEKSRQTSLQTILQ